MNVPTQSPIIPQLLASVYNYFVTFTAVMRPHEGNYDVDCPADSNYCGDSDEEEDPERLLDVWLGELDSLASVNRLLFKLIRDIYSVLA